MSNKKNRPASSPAPVSVVRSGGLLTETVTVVGRVITVSQATMRMMARKQDIQATVDSRDDLTAGEKILIGFYYAPLSACSTGDVPTEKEFLDDFRDTDIDEWYQTVKRLNPHWFVVEELNEELLKKKETSATKST